MKRQKRIMDFVRLIGLLEEMQCDYKFDFVGVGQDRDELFKAVKGFVRVSVLNGVSQPEMTRIYTGYDILLLVSDSEGMSIAMLEAMAHGLVPVVTRVSGAEDIISDGENGFLIDVGDMKSMAERVARLSVDKGQLQFMASNAIATVNTNFSLRKYTDAFHRLVDHTMEKPLIEPSVALACLQTI